MMSFFARTITEMKSGHTTIVLFPAWSQKLLGQSPALWYFSESILEQLLTRSCLPLNPEAGKKSRIFPSDAETTHTGSDRFSKSTMSQVSTKKKCLDLYVVLILEWKYYVQALYRNICSLETYRICYF